MLTVFEHRQANITCFCTLSQNFFSVKVRESGKVENPTQAHAHARAPAKLFPVKGRESWAENQGPIHMFPRKAENRGRKRDVPKRSKTLFRAQSRLWFLPDWPCFPAPRPRSLVAIRLREHCKMSEGVDVHFQAPGTEFETKRGTKQNCQGGDLSAHRESGQQEVCKGDSRSVPYSYMLCRNYLSLLDHPRDFKEAFA